jgi:hypothetical protein
MPAPVLINGVPNKPLLLTPQHDAKRGQTSSPGVALAPSDTTTAGVPYGPLFASPDKVDPHGAPASPLFTSIADPHQHQQQHYQHQHAYPQPAHEPLPGALFHQPSASTLSSPLSAHPHHHGGGYDPHGAYIDPRAEPDYGAHLRSGSFDHHPSHHNHHPLSHGYGEQQHHNPHEHLAAAVAGQGDDEFYSPYVTPAKDHGNRPRPDLSVQVRPIYTLTRPLSSPNLAPI